MSSTRYGWPTCGHPAPHDSGYSPRELIAHLAALTLLLGGCAAEVDPLMQDELDSAWEATPS